METIEAKTKVKMDKVKDDVLIFISNDIQIKFNKIFEWPDSNGSRVAHLNIWDNNAPFYILYNKQLQQKLNIKGYKNCYFIPNSFLMEYGKDKKLRLRATDKGANCIIKFHPITSVKDIRNIVKLKWEGKMVFAGFPKSDYISTFGECFELCKIK